MSNTTQHTLTKERIFGLICAYIVTLPHVSKRFNVGDYKNANQARAVALKWAQAQEAQAQEAQAQATKIIKTKTTKTKTKATAKKRASAYVVEYPSFYLAFTALNGSNNRKTGDMVQTYLIDKERLISEPKTFGAKCEACPMVNKCYVSRDKLSVRKALVKLTQGEATSYAFATLDEVLPLLQGRLIRLGTYGDPSAIPLRDLARICESAKGHTGYTHFWREVDADYSAYLMSSCESLSDELLSNALGYRAFRVLLDDQETHETTQKSVQCLNASVGLTCAECLLCSGTKGKGSSNIYIHEH